jgi:hypothetical protein
MKTPIKKKSQNGFKIKPWELIWFFLAHESTAFKHLAVSSFCAATIFYIG